LGIGDWGFGGGGFGGRAKDPKQKTKAQTPQILK